MREGSNLRNSGRAIGETSRVPGEAVKVICADIDPLIRAERKSDTEVREVVNPAITKETVIKENRETTITAVDRELHQDHYQTRVQPVVDRQILPEEHLHKQAPVEYKEHRHHKGDEIRRALEEERSRFKSTREVLPTKHTVEAGDTVVGEHHHHHVYETVQPVIEREIIQPIITHTTIPIHERIEKDPSFHPKTIQPVMTMEEFLRAGGTLEGRAERVDLFEGEPQVMENGGADQTHPNAWDAKGHHIDVRAGTEARVRGVGIAQGATSGERGEMTTTTTTTTIRRTEQPMRTASPLTATERERVMQGNNRTRSPLASPGLHTAGRTSAV
ncbi:hypothetical protein L211DRAFT_788094 [Terfezia boudieri ATCC MYA-4762]|uniref:Allergen n=1 Tax=Terfezia boudieri ATCC MYA-4762 TaxID=1051890 RepID=A0A3N4LMQ5_9PEZI|nr:hypothetical protein L211DRAFT_788094 [Terfezia boudieri ATCC MYA-4762]